MTARWLSGHRRAAGVALRGLGRTPIATLSIVVTLGTALALPLLGYRLWAMLSQVAERFGGNPQITLYLDPRGTSAATGAVEKALRARRDVSSVKKISREQALADLDRAGAFGNMLSGLAVNPLPDALIVTPTERAPAKLASMRAELARLPGVETVELDVEWVRQLDRMVEAGAGVLALVASLMAVGIVSTAFSSIRLQVVSRAEEIEVGSLFGATQPQLRRPFLYHGVLQGAASGLAAIGIAAAAIGALRGGIGQALAGIGFPPLTFPDLDDGLIVVAAAALLGWLGARLSVGQQLRDMDRL